MSGSDSRDLRCGAAQGTRIGQATAMRPLPEQADFRVPPGTMRLVPPALWIRLQAMHGYGEIEVIRDPHERVLRVSQSFDYAQAIAEASNYAELACRVVGTMTLEIENRATARLSVEVVLPG